MAADVFDVITLSRADSLDLLRSVPVGRIVFTERAMPAIAAVNFSVLRAGDVVIRTDQGSSLAVATRDAVVAFQADDFSDDTVGPLGWSVTVTGRARRVHSEDELAEIAQEMGESWSVADDSDVIRVSADIVEGHRSTQSS